MVVRLYVPNTGGFVTAIENWVVPMWTLSDRSWPLDVFI